MEIEDMEIEEIEEYLENRKISFSKRWTYTIFKDADDIEWTANISTRDKDSYISDHDLLIHIPNGQYNPAIQRWVNKIFIKR